MKTCSDCDGELDSEGVCTECGLDTKEDFFDSEEQPEEEEEDWKE